MKWRTLISEWDPPHRFIDTQLKGPYKKWVHQHDFYENDGETVIRDTVHYQVPGWFLAPLVHKFFVKQKVERIFEYREQTIKNLFK